MKKRKTVSITEEHDAQIKAYVAETGLSEGDVIDQALDLLFGHAPVSISDAAVIVAAQTREINEKFDDLKEFIKDIHK